MLAFSCILCRRDWKSRLFLRIKLFIAIRIGGRSLAAQRWFNVHCDRFVDSSVAFLIRFFPHRGSSISLGSDRLPGPFFVEPDRSEIPDAHGRAEIASGIYDWYQRHSSSESLVQTIASIFGLNGAQ